MDSKDNTGTSNSGYYNSGDFNSGNRNSGDFNSGSCNSGDFNSGSCNSGDFNSGSCNSGDFNSGDWNSGSWNSGDYNSGDYNSGDWNSGFFNTNEPKLRLFNKDSNMTRSEFVEKHGMIYPDLKVTTWVSYKDLPESEQNTDTKNMDGKLKTLTYHEAWAEYWGHASKDDKKWFQSLPNFDAAIFKEITGIDVGVQSLSGKEVTVTVDGKTFIAVIK